MNTLSADTISNKLGGVTDAVKTTVDTIDVSSIDLSNVIDSVEGATSSAVDAATDLADAAGTATVVGGRFVARTARRGGRFVTSHPKGAIVSILMLLGLAGALTWYRRNDASTSAQTDLKVAA